MLRLLTGESDDAGAYHAFDRAIEEASDPRLIDGAFTHFPILHAFVELGSAGSLPGRVNDHVRGLVSLYIEGATDQTVSLLLADDRVRTLRRLKVHGPVSLSMSAVELLCEADLPDLEELEIWGGSVVNPCDIAASDNWAEMNPRAYAIMSRAGAKLEERYGYRKFLHAASRFSVYPCSPAALDILPPLPPERFVRPREWGDR